MNRITVTENPDFTRRSPGAMVSVMAITTVDGRRHTVRSEYPKGHPQHPMTDRDVETKFRSFGEPVLGTEGCDMALEMLWSLEQAVDIGDGLRRLVPPPNHTSH